MSSSNGVAVEARQLHKLYRLNAHQGSLRTAVGNALRRVGRRNGQPREDDRLWALEDVSFQLEQGEAMGVIGPNGAGKTTLLKLLSRVTRPTRGSVKVRGRFAALIELGAGFHPDLTGRENIYLNGAIHGLSRQEIDRKFDAIVDFSGLEKFIDTPVKRYSSGMYVRLGFSVASYTEPSVLLVDEVLAVGDSDFRRKCAQHIHKLRREGVTAIFVSHNLAQVRAICDRGIFLVDGKIKTKADIDETIGSYRRWMSKGKRSRVVSSETREETELFGDSLRIFEVQTLDRSGQRRHQFDFAERISVEARYTASAKLESLNYVVRIIRSDGTRSAEIRSSSLGLDRLTVDGQGAIRFAFDEPRLVSDSYVIELRVRDAEDTTTLAVGLSPQFEVTAPISAEASEGVYLPNFVPAIAAPEADLVAN